VSSSGLAERNPQVLLPAYGLMKQLLIGKKSFAAGRLGTRLAISYFPWRKERHNNKASQPFRMASSLPLFRASRAEKQDRSMPYYEDDCGAA
jgi:hypothetical protein